MNEIYISIIQIAFAAGMGCNLFIVARLYGSKSFGQQPITIGIAILLVWAVRFILIYVKMEEWITEFPVLIVIDQHMFFLDGPLLWMYSRSVFQRINFGFKAFLHFLPFTLLASYSIIYALVNPAAIEDAFAQAVDSLFGSKPILDIGVIILIAAILLFSVFYFLRSIIEIRRFNQALKDQYSNIEKLNADWVITFQRFWIMLFLMPLFIYLTNYVYPIVNIYVTGPLLVLSLISLSVYFGFNLLDQSYVSLNEEAPDLKEKVVATPNESETKKLEELYHLLEEHKYYQDEQLSLDQLSAYMEMRSKDLTELIKKSTHDNFYDLINSFRIDAVKESLKTSSEQIIVIAYQCGFNSKSAFNKIFKEKTGMTPKEYRLSLT